MNDLSGAMLEMTAVVQRKVGRPRTVSGDVLDQQILGLALKGETPKKIAFMLDVESRFVSGRLWYLRKAGHPLPVFRAGRKPESRLNVVPRSDMTNEIVLLRREGWSFGEISDELGIDEGTVRRINDTVRNRKSSFKSAIAQAARINHARGDEGEMPASLRWGVAAPTEPQLRAVNTLHLIDLKRAGHSPKVTELNIPPDENRTVFCPTQERSYCGSPSSMMLEYAYDPFA